MFNSIWYQNLVRPPLTPPTWLFSPVWTVLYILMAVSLFLYAKKYTEKSKVWGYILFFTQIILNLSWAPTFFLIQNIALALIIVILLDILVLFNIIEFSKISKISANLLIPYFIWILFATYLNFAYLLLN